jgi:acyl CoA:acetate/3-ketoacid CoA transferase beta subunit
MAVLGFHPETRDAMLISLHPGVSLEQVRENTGFPLRVPHPIPETSLPTAEELRLLREEIDPRRVYLG